MKQWVLMLALTCSIAPGFFQHLSADLSYNYTVMYSRYYLSGADTAADKVISRELQFYSGLLMIPARYSFYKATASADISSPGQLIKTGLTENVIRLDLDSTVTRTATNELQNWVAVEALQQFIDIMIKKYRIQFDEGQEGIFKGYLTGYYLSERNAYFKSAKADESSQMAFFKQSIFADKNTEADICIKAFDTGLQEGYLAEKQRQRLTLRDIVSRGLVVAYQP